MSSPEIVQENSLDTFLAENLEVFFLTSLHLGLTSSLIFTTLNCRIDYKPAT